MSTADGWAIPAAAHEVEHVVSRSRFRALLAHAPTADAAHAVVAARRAEHPAATHHCWAFVAGPPGSTRDIGLSDDGEPHGTAGRPILTVLQHGDVGEIVAVVTRWYGGTKLGTGGLARAYGAVVQEALATLPRARRTAWREARIAVAWAHHEAVRQLVRDAEGDVTDATWGVDVRLDVRVPASAFEAWLARVDDVTRGQARRLDP